MKLYKSGLALKREGTDETVAAFINEQDLDNVLEAVMTKKKPNKPVPGDESNESMAMPSAARDEGIELAAKMCDRMVSTSPLNQYKDAAAWLASRIRNLKGA